ncbi:MAG: hypothetical protein NC086_01330 [Alistipes sp.]|nr:hypothetical protein [Alistipes sp.]
MTDNYPDFEQGIDITKRKIAELNDKIVEYKRLHPDYKGHGVYKSMVQSLSALQKKLAELKQTRKVTTSAARQLKYKIFKELVAERLGQEEMEKIEQEAKERTQEYRYNLATRTFVKK